MRRNNIELVERDLKIFELIKKVGWVRQDNIAYYLGLNYQDSKVNTIIRGIGFRLQKHGYIIKKRFIAGLPNYWCFSRLGAELNEGICEPKFVLQNAKHDDLVAKLMIEYLRDGVQDITTEFELKHQVIFNKDKKVKIPDLIINETTAVEVEISLKNPARIGAIIRQYKFGNYEQVIYYTTEKIATAMLNNTTCDSKFKFKIIDENCIINSPEFIIKQKNNIVTNSQSDDRQKLRERLGI